MINPVAISLLIGTFFFLIIFRMHIAFAMAIATVVTTVYVGLPVQVVAQNMVQGLNVFAFMAVPFFIIAGEIMGSGGISNRLINLSNALVGWLRGGLAMVNIVASMFFGGISGSATADTSSIGPILIPMMKKQGYDGEFSTCVTMASSVQGILIPPSHNMVMYAMVAGSVSIGKLFLAGFAPGIFLGIALMIYSYFISIKRNYPVGDKFDIKLVLKTGRDAIWGLGTVLIVVVGVVAGVFTATESAAIAVVYSFMVTFFIYREIKVKEFIGILSRSMKTLAIILILVASASAFGWMVAYLQIPALLTNAILSLTTNKYIVLFIVNILFLILGMIMSMSSIILILTPIMIPIVTKLGVDPVHFGIIMMLNLGIGLLTPPVGGVLFIGSAISDIKIEKLSRAMLPFYAVMIAVLLIITYVPEVVMFLPKMLMK